VDWTLVTSNVSYGVINKMDYFKLVISLPVARDVDSNFKLAISRLFLRPVQSNVALN